MRERQPKRSFGRYLLSGSMNVPTYGGSSLTGSLLMIALAFSLLSSPSSAAAEKITAHHQAWQLIGPGGGGHLTSLIVDHADPNILYASVNCGGIRKSIDGGIAWEMRNRDFDYERHGIQAQKIAALAQHPTDPWILLASSFNGQIFTSSDRAESWQLSYTFPGASNNESFSYFAFDPKDPNTVYTSIGGNIDRLLTPVKPGVERHAKISRGAILRGQHQVDGRWTWTEIGELRDPQGRPLNSYSGGVNPENTREMFFITRGGVYRGMIEQGRLSPKLVDHRKAGLPEPSEFDGGKIVFDPRRKGAVYMTVMNLRGPGGGFFKSDDGGQTWRKMTRGLDAQNTAYYDLQLHPTNDQTLYLALPRNKTYEGDRAYKTSGGLYRSTDRGESWQSITDTRTFQWGWKVVGEKLFGAIYIAVSRQNPKTLYFTASAGQIFATDDVGLQRPLWRQITTRAVADQRWITTGLEAIALPHSVGIDPANPKVLYIPYGDHGIFKSEDGGRSLRLLPRPGSTYGGNIVLDERKPGRLYLATRGPHLQLEDGEMLVSDDAGEGWRFIGGEKGFSGSWVSKKHAQVSPLAAKEGKKRPPHKGRKREKSGLKGQDNKSSPMYGLPRGAMTSIRIQYLEGDLRTLYVCNYSYGLYVKEGENPWRQILAESGCRSLAQRNNFQELYVGVDGKGIYKLTRQGKHWQSALIAPASWQLGDTFFDMETGPETNTIYTGTDKGVFALDSRNQLEQRLAKRDAMAVEVNPRNESILYAGGPYHGVWKSSDRGRTWRNISADLPGRAVMVLKVSPAEPDTIFVASRCSGIWKKDFAAVLQK